MVRRQVRKGSRLNAALEEPSRGKNLLRIFAESVISEFGLLYGNSLMATNQRRQYTVAVDAWPVNCRCALPPSASACHWPESFCWGAQAPGGEPQSKSPR